MPAKLTTATPTKADRSVHSDGDDLADDDAASTTSLSGCRKNVSADPALGKSLDVSFSSVEGDAASPQPTPSRPSTASAARPEEASPSSILGEDDSFAKYVANRMRDAASPGTSEDASFVTLQDTRSPENENGVEKRRDSNGNEKMQQPQQVQQQQQQQQKRTPPPETKAETKGRTNSQSRAKDALKKRRSSEVGRVASWATKFEKLLCDDWGRDLFKQFLRQEYR